MPERQQPAGQDSSATPADSTVVLDVATLIASSTTAAEIATVIVDTMTAVFGASASRVALFENVEEDQRGLTVLMMAGSGAQRGVSATEPVAIAAYTGTPSFSDAVVAIPLGAHDHKLGAFDVEFPPSRSLALGERRFLEHLGRQAGAGLFRIRTIERERTARLQLEERNGQLLALHEELDRSAKHFRAVNEALPVGILLYDADGLVAYANQYALRVLGREPHATLLHDWRAFVHAEDTARVEAAIASRMPDTGSVDFRFVHPDGRVCWVGARHDAIAIDSDAADHHVLTFSDITERRGNEDERAQLEAQLRQAQKMEAVGQLAGGIAHDFNNLLMIMLGNLELVEMRADVPEAERAYLGEVHSAAERAIGLTRQLLTFSRRASPRVRPIDLNDVVAHAEKLLTRAIGETNAIVLALDPRPSWVLGDAGQMEQILLNLAVNARDAMRDGGIVTITTGRTTLGPDDRDRWRTLPPGEYIQLSVSDTGEGMTPEVRDRVFDPFFTTKPLGQGTGLGLAMVYGIVTQANGAVDVQSSPGHGTTLTILLPESTSESPAELPAAPTAPRREGTVLLVEDEPAVRAVLRATLAKQGFRVVEAQHGRDALLVWREQRDSIDVVVTDLRMPEMGGRSLAAALHAEAPNLPVIFMSGYDEDALPETEAAGVGETVLQKPFATADLVARILDLLENGPPRT